MPSREAGGGGGPGRGDRGLGDGGDSGDGPRRAAPQSINQLGGFRVQRGEQRLLQDAQSAEQAGAFAVVLECIPASISAVITRTLRIPTIGIGAGPDCDGQVLVTHDLLGLGKDPLPRFVREYAHLGQAVGEAVARYVDDVQKGVFPAGDESYE